MYFVIRMAMVMAGSVVGILAADARSASPTTHTVHTSATFSTTTSAPASMPASAAFTSPGTDVIRLRVEGLDSPAAVWVHRPAGYAAGQRPPLIVCLHGTDDTAQQMIEFWQARRMRIPAVLVAPQGIGKGWSSGDEATIRVLFDRLPSQVWYDSHRVLLAGFSAGGVMTFQMIYKGKVPATAAVCLANYVPPRLTAEDVRDRRHVPVFYAVGMADVNHELMRTGLDFLRSAGANVELYHPTIGHTLDPNVAQAAMDWFADQCVRQIDGDIEKAARAQEVGPAVERLEQIVSQPNWHDARQVAGAKQVLATLEGPGEKSLQGIDNLLRENKPAQAVQLLKELEAKYGITRLGTAARKKREALEADPLIRLQVRQSESSRRAELAMAEYARVQKLVAQQRLADAEEACRRIVSTYGETPAADRARKVLKLLRP